MKKIIYALFFARSSKISSANDKRNSIRYLIFLLSEKLWLIIHSSCERIIEFMEKGPYGKFVQYLGNPYYDENGNWNG